MKHVDISEVTSSIAKLVDEAGRGREIVITRDGQPLAKLGPAKREDEPAALTPEQAAKRREAITRLIEIGNRLKINATHAQIKAWIEEGRH
jgi:antitoxin (DNA-binding transcriptional repressor) of toxin-antitoxin stability system